MENETVRRPNAVPDWLKNTISRKIPPQKEPDTLDFQIVSAALAGVEMEALKKRFDIAASEIQASLLRVASSVREGKIDSETFDAYPDLRALKPPRERKKKPGDRLARIVEEKMALEVMDDSDLPEIVPGNDESFHAYLVAAKVKFARRIVPDTMRALHSNVKSLDGMVSNMAVAKSLEMYYGVGRRGPGVVQQFNVGGEKGGEGQPETPHFFEQTILEAEKAEGTSGGEVTVFDERLLGQQEEG